MQKNKLELYKLFLSYIEKPGFTQIIRGASQICRAPIVFTDENYQLIAQYPNAPIDDVVFDTYLEEHELPIELIAQYQKAYLNEAGKHYKPFFQEEGIVGQWPRVFAEVFSENVTLGHIGMFLDKKDFTPWHLEAAEVLCDVLKTKMLLTKEPRLDQSKFLKTLLSDSASFLTKEKALAALKDGLRNPGMLLVFPIAANKAERAFANMALDYCKRNFSNGISVIHENSFVILLPNRTNSSSEILREYAEQISSFFNQYPIKGGAVYPINNYLKLNQSYYKALLTALLNAEEAYHSLLFSSDVMLQPLYKFIAQLPEGSAYIHPSLYKMKEYDRENGTDYYLTLNAYCQHLFRKNDTAESLHIHRNTLLYRLQKIDELFHVDTNDKNTLEHLFISFKLIKYEKGIEKRGQSPTALTY